MKNKHMNRRTFIAAAVASAPAFTFSTSAWSQVLGANERVRFALIGCGGVGVEEGS